MSAINFSYYTCFLVIEVLVLLFSALLCEVSVNDTRYSRDYNDYRFYPSSDPFLIEKVSCKLGVMVPLTC